MIQKLQILMCLLQPGLTGVCGVLTYQLELDPEEEPEYVQVMFSVPYNLNSYDSYLAVGVSPVYLNSSDGGVFKTFYYYSGSFQRSKAGRMAEYQSEKGDSLQVPPFVISFQRVVNILLQ